MSEILLSALTLVSLITLAISFLMFKKSSQLKSIEDLILNLEPRINNLEIGNKEFQEKQNSTNLSLLNSLNNLTQSLDKDIERVERSLKEELIKNRDKLEQHSKSATEDFNNHTKTSREDFNTYARYAREELNKTLNQFRDEMVTSMKNSSETVSTNMRDLSRLQQEQLKSFAEQLKHLGSVIENRLKNLQDDNNKKLEEMRLTVDEKLHNTLEKRLNESFKSVTDMLEQVYKGLGEMQSLATGVGDLKKVLTNVKTRGTWGEMQLANLLDQVLTPEQYSKNVGIKANTTERVDFAIKLPGANEKDSEVWLPIDAKFPQEDYQKLVEIQEAGDKTLYDQASKQLEQRIKLEAKSIKEKYISPPKTTDFAILFLPIEGLYAEVLRRPGLAETLQRDYRVVIAGPTTLAALLNSLQMGFRTLAIEKRSSEVWQILAAVKSEFGKFGDILDKTQKKLQEASNTIESASRKSRTIERKLKKVEQLPGAEDSGDPSSILLSELN